jgi:hypothetical protein
MKIFKFTMILLTILAGFSITFAQDTSKKLIEFGWNMPSPEYLRDNISAIERTPFDGLVVRPSVGNDVFTVDAYDSSVFDTDISILQSIEYTKLTDNFLIMWGTSEEGWLWTNDAHWQSAEQNIRNFARMASLGGFKGILWDAEVYGWNPWEYNTDRYPDMSFNDVEVVVFGRGQRFMTVIQEEFPDVKILSIWLMGTILGAHESYGDDISPDHYALYAAFVSGMFATLNDSAQIIDGNESSYYYLNDNDFSEANDYLRSGSRYLFPEVSEKANDRMMLGHAVYVDGVLDLWNSPRFLGYYMADDEARLNLYRRNLYHALQTSDEYVWVYNENMNWWTGDIPAGLEEATIETVALVNNNQPLGFDLTDSLNFARQEFDRRINIWGDITDANGNQIEGVEILSGITDEEGDESACVVYNINYYGCVFPYGWSGSIKPVKEGYRFEPEVINYESISEGGLQTFTAYPNN